jgi:hypothetical protein
MFTKIKSTSTICFSLLKSNPPQLVVHATGVVPTGSWTDGRLIPYVYVTPPQDGIQDFDFVARAPKGYVIQVESPISASWIGTFPVWMKGARVHSSTNSVEESITDAACLHNVIEIKQGIEVPWPAAAGGEVPWP